MKIKRRLSDKLFSDWIRNRDRWTCQRCFTYYPEGTRAGVECSHFHTRKKESTRFYPDNCVTFCTGCHFYLGNSEHRDEYKKFMINWLGKKRFEKLNALSLIYKKRDDKLEAMVWREALKQQSLEKFIHGRKA